jgi:hypothetical protein
MRTLLARLLCFALWSLGALPALAQSPNTDTYFYTPGGGGVNGALGMCLNASNKAVPCSAANVVPGPSSITDGTNGPVTVKPGSTPATNADKAMVVELRPDSPGIIQPGPSTAATSTPVTIGPPLLGSYCMGANTGTMAAGLAGGAPIYSFRYGGANLAIVRKVLAEANDVTTAFVAGAAKLDVIPARSFSVSDTGGTAATLTGNNGKLRTSFATTAVSDLRISSTATLTAGTRTLDAQPIASVEFPVSTAIDAALLPTTTLYQAQVGESPLVLATNEGFVIQATVPGTGTWSGSVRVCWDEVSAF